MNETLIPHRIRHWPLPARFQAFLLLLPAIAIATMPFVERWSQAVLVGFDAAALVFMLSLWSLTRDHTPGQMRATSVRRTCWTWPSCSRPGPVVNSMWRATPSTT